MTFTDIADLLGYHRTSTSAKIKNRRIPGNQNLYGTSFIYCEHEKECNKFTNIGCKKNVVILNLSNALFWINLHTFAMVVQRKMNADIINFYYHAIILTENKRSKLLSLINGLTSKKSALNNLETNFQLKFSD
ncbi:MAG: hypothetical protein MR598_05335 [Erysipelotrichaceae bacterium]|nr:hypothetical protein [Erysipelotrichaceae bacterium]